MPSILTIIQTPKDAVFMRQALLRTNFKIFATNAVYSNYIKMLQYEPDVVLMELAPDPRPQLYFLKAVRTNRTIAQKPFIVYGPTIPQNVLDVVMALGATIYMPRPIDPAMIVAQIQNACSHIKQKMRMDADVNQMEHNALDALRDRQKPVEERLDLMMKHVGKLLAFPATVAQILKVTQNEKSGAGELSSVILTDPAVSTEVLKVANSVHFTRGNNKRIADMKDAIVRIGFGQTKTIAMSISVFKMAGDKNFQTGFNHADFWFHSIGVAIIAEKIARQSKLVEPEEAFIGGLLHDLGLLIYNEYFNDLFLKLLERCTAKGVPFHQHERDILGFTHNDLLARLFKTWNFPEAVERLPEQLCTPQLFTDQNVKNAPLAAIVSLSEIIAKSLRIGREADCCITPVPNDLMEMLRFPYGIQKAFVEDVFNNINMFNQLLKIDSRTFPQDEAQITQAKKMHLVCHSFSSEIFNPIDTWLSTQGYRISRPSTAAEIPDFMRKNHALVVTGVTMENMDHVEELNMSPCAPFDSHAPGPVPVQPGDTRPECKARFLILDADGSIGSFTASPTMIVSRYPVDLRAVDMAVSMLISEPILPPELIVDNILRLPIQAALSGNSRTTSLGLALVATGRSEIREKMTEALRNLPVTIETTNEGPKAVNLAKTSATEICMVIIDVKIPFLPPADIVRQIRAMPNHKRAIYLAIVGNVMTKEQIVPLAQLGIRNFVKESSTPEEISEFFKAQLEARLEKD